MLEQKQGQLWNLHKIAIKVAEKYFQILVKNFLLEVKCQKMWIFENNYSTIRKSHIIKKK